jgi:hypothetical protein
MHLCACAYKVPLDLLREWALIALERRDTGMLGMVLTVAAACGHTLDVL